MYTRYRFLQRETRWKGLEDSLDECIDESMRTLDQVSSALAAIQHMQEILEQPPALGRYLLTVPEPITGPIFQFFNFYFFENCFARTLSPYTHCTLD